MLTLPAASCWPQLCGAIENFLLPWVEKRDSRKQPGLVPGSSIKDSWRSQVFRRSRKKYWTALAMSCARSRWCEASRLRRGWATSAGPVWRARHGRTQRGPVERLVAFAGNRSRARAREGGERPSCFGLRLGRQPLRSPGLGSSTDPVSWGFSVPEVWSGRSRAAHPAS